MIVDPETVLYTELWRASAGPLVTVPLEGERVFYFPQGHIEQDNGRGMPHDDIPNMFGRVLSGTKYGLKQTRGKFGLGAKMALIWSKMSTGLPIDISSSMKGQNYSSFCKLDIDIHRTFLTFTYMKNGTIRNDGMELKSKLLLRGIEQLTVIMG
ncbi:unnamed protein product [Camellia sinensis]